MRKILSVFIVTIYLAASLTTPVFAEEFNSTIHISNNADKNTQNGVTYEDTEDNSVSAEISGDTSVTIDSNNSSKNNGRPAAVYVDVAGENNQLVSNQSVSLTIDGDLSVEHSDGCYTSTALNVETSNDYTTGSTASATVNGNVNYTNFSETRVESYVDVGVNVASNYGTNNMAQAIINGDVKVQGTNDEAGRADNAYGIQLWSDDHNSSGIYVKNGVL